MEKKNPYDWPYLSGKDLEQTPSIGTKALFAVIVGVVFLIASIFWVP